MLIDCHCHLSLPEFSPDLSKILEELKVNFFRVIESTINPENTKKALKLFKDTPLVNFALGFHPYYCDTFNKQILKEYARIIELNNNIIAIGEVGLDIKSKAGLDKQKEVFSEFIDLAKQFNLPVIVHNRGFKETALSIIKEKRIKKVIFHCFSQDKDFLNQIIKNGFLVSFAGNLTFKNAYSLRDAAKNCPNSNILSETDSPYLAPQIIRGKRNTPQYVKEVIKEIAAIKENDSQLIQKITLDNAKNIFNLT